jgi:hypothetical protein
LDEFKNENVVVKPLNEGNYFPDFFLADKFLFLFKSKDRILSSAGTANANFLLSTQPALPGTQSVLMRMQKLFFEFKCGQENELINKILKLFLIR